jgi:plastocyanin
VQIHVVSSADDKDPMLNSFNKKMPVIGIVVLLVIIVVGAFIFASGSNNTSNSGGSAALAAVAPAEVSITSTAFVPSTIKVRVGQAVTWTNTDSTAHVVASDPYPTDNGLAGFDSKQQLDTNDRFSYVFNKVGTYTYHDDLNPYSMDGTVVVTN